MGTAVRPSDESSFQSWYRNWASKAGLDPDPDSPLHKYDYRAAFRAGATPQIDSGDGLYHWPSEFKADDHPNRFVNGVDTKKLDSSSSQSHNAMTSPYVALQGIDSDLARQELDEFMKQREKQYNDMRRILGLTGSPMVPPPAGAGVVPSALPGMVPPQPQSRQIPPPLAQQIDLADRPELVGIAKAWGGELIPFPEQQNSDALRARVKQLRGEMPAELPFDPQANPQANRIIAGTGGMTEAGIDEQRGNPTGVDPWREMLGIAANIGLGGAGAVPRWLDNVPVLGEIMKKSAAVDFAKQTIAKLQEGVRMSLSPEDDGTYTDSGAGAGHAFGMFPMYELGYHAIAAAGVATGVPLFAQLGNKVGAIARAGIQGAGSFELVEGGRPGLSLLPDSGDIEMAGLGTPDARDALARSLFGNHAGGMLFGAVTAMAGAALLSRLERSRATGGTRSTGYQRPGEDMAEWSWEGQVGPSSGPVGGPGLSSGQRSIGPGQYGLPEGVVAPTGPVPAGPSPAPFQTSPVAPAPRAGVGQSVLFNGRQNPNPTGGTNPVAVTGPISGPPRLMGPLRTPNKGSARNAPGLIEEVTYELQSATAALKQAAEAGDFVKLQEAETVIKNLTSDLDRYSGSIQFRQPLALADAADQLLPLYNRRFSLQFNNAAVPQYGQTTVMDSYDQLTADIDNMFALKERHLDATDDMQIPALVMKRAELEEANPWLREYSDITQQIAQVEGQLGYEPATLELANAKIETMQNLAREFVTRAGTKVVDKNGNALMVLHGSGTAGFVADVNYNIDEDGLLSGPGFYAAGANKPAAFEVTGGDPDLFEPNPGEDGMSNYDGPPPYAVGRAAEGQFEKKRLLKRLKDLAMNRENLEIDIQQNATSAPSIGNLGPHSSAELKNQLAYIDSEASEIEEALLALPETAANVSPYFIMADKVLLFDDPIPVPDALHIVQTAMRTSGLEAAIPALQAVEQQLLQQGGVQRYDSRGWSSTDTPQQVVGIQGKDVYHAVKSAVMTSQAASRWSTYGGALKEVLLEAGYQVIHNKGGMTSSGKHNYDAYNVIDQNALVPAYADEALLLEKARGRGIALTKQAQIMQSVVLPDLAATTEFTDVDVAHAALAARPNGAVLIRGVADPGRTLSELLGSRMVESGIMPKSWRIVEKDGRLDMILSTLKEVDDQMVADYQQYGMFAGQRVIKTVKGNSKEGIVTGFGLSKAGKPMVFVQSMDKPLLAKKGKVVNRSAGVLLQNVQPMPDAPEVIENDAMYTQFMEYADSQLALTQQQVGLAEPVPLLSAAGRARMPMYLEKFLDNAGVGDPAVRVGLRAYFDIKLVEEYRSMAPEENALDQAVSDELDMIHEAQQFADRPNLTLIKPDLPDPQVVSLADRMPSSQFDMVGVMQNASESLESLEMAAPLRDELYEPDASVHELAIARGMKAYPDPTSAGWTLRDTVAARIFNFVDDDAVRSFLQNFSREGVELDPGGDVPLDIMRNIGRDTGDHYPLPQESIQQGIMDIEEMQRVLDEHRFGFSAPQDDPFGVLYPQRGDQWLGGAGGRGDGGSGDSGAYTGGNGPSNALIGPGSKPYNFRQMASHMGDVYRKFDSLMYEYVYPIRATFQDLEGVLDDMGYGALRPWRDFDNINSNMDVAHNEAHPFHTRLSKDVDKLSSAQLKKGFAWKLLNEPNAARREVLAQTFGFSPEQIDAVNDIEALVVDMHGDRYFEHWPQLRKFVNKTQTSQIDDKANPYGDDKDYLSVGFFVRHAKEGHMRFVDTDVSSIIHSYIRAYTFDKHVAAHWDKAKATWSVLERYQDSDGRRPLVPLARMFLDWMDTTRRGYEPGRDLALKAVKAIFEPIFPITTKEASQVIGYGLNTVNRALLGWRLHTVIRDASQPMLAAPYVGMANMSSTMADLLRGSDETKGAIIDKMSRWGILHKGLPPMESFAIPEEDLGGVERQFNIKERKRREFWTKTSDLARDMLPTWMRSISGTKVDPLWLYTNQGAWARVLVGESAARNFDNTLEAWMGMRSQAVEGFNTGQVVEMPSVDDFMAAANITALAKPVQRRVAEQMAAGDFDGANRTYSNEVTNLVLLQYGLRNAAPGMRNHTAKIVGHLGSFPAGMVNYVRRTALGPGSVPFKAKAALFHSALAGALMLAEAKTGWKFSKWIWFSTFGYRGGPAVGAINALREGAALGASVMAGREPTRLEERDAGALAQPGVARNVINTIDPFAGARYTGSGMAGAMNSNNPIEGMGRFLLMGDRSQQGTDWERRFNDEEVPTLPNFPVGGGAGF